MGNQPFHDGEIAVQERAGERDIARRHGAGISSRIVPGALSFLARQRLVALSAAGDDGHLWTSVWCGEPGFVQSADGQRVSILPSLMTASPDDPVLRRLALGRDLGILADRVRLPASPSNQRDGRGRLGGRNRRPRPRKRSQLPQIHPAAPATRSFDDAIEPKTQ